MVMARIGDATPPPRSTSRESSALILAADGQETPDKRQREHDNPDGANEHFERHHRLRRQLARDRIEGTQSPTKMPYSLLTKNQRTTEKQNEMDAAASQRIIDKFSFCTVVLLTLIVHIVQR
jgi:hypothetical protein